jgi:aryl-alcohol dehydrogenase-like predicted oxidoreductase
MFDRFMASGGNFIAAKVRFNAEPSNPKAGGNRRKNIHRALEGSLHRLRTDYVDLYYVHAWDRVTPVEKVVLRKLTERRGEILDAATGVAEKLGKTPAQIGLNRVATQPGITSTILGATKIGPLEENLGAIEFAMPAELPKTLDQASASEPGAPYAFFGTMIQSRIGGGTALHAWSPAKVHSDLNAPPLVPQRKANAGEK